MRKIEINCDFCGKDITDKSRINICQDNYTIGWSSLQDMEYQLCSIPCLKAWAIEKKCPFAGDKITTK